MVRQSIEQCAGRRSRPGHVQADATAERRSRANGPVQSGRNPSPPCSRRQSRARPAAVRRCAWPCAVALPALSDPCPGSRRSPVTAVPASASSQASCACTPAAARTGTSCPPSRGSNRIPAPLHGGYSPRRTETPDGSIDFHGKHPGHPPKGKQPNHWPGIKPARTTQTPPLRGLICHRRAHDATPVFKAALPRLNCS